MGDTCSACNAKNNEDLTEEIDAQKDKLQSYNDEQPKENSEKK